MRNDQTKRTDRYFFYWQFLTQEDQNLRKERLAVEKPKRKGLFRYVRACIGCFVFLAKVLQLPKGKYVFMNHTARVRKGPNGTTSLYLDRFLKELDSCIVFDEQRNSISYPRSVIALQYEDLDLMITLFCRLFSKDKLFASFKIKIWIWSKIFAFLKPKAIVLLVWYGKLWVIGAAKHAKVKSVELQHGRVYKEHNYYHFYLGKDVADSDFLIPDEAWCYGDYWTEAMVGNGFPFAQAKTIGYFLDTSVKQRLEFPYILYVSIGESPIELEELLHHIKPELIARGWKCIIAPHPHPVENVRVHYERLLDDTVRIYPHMDTYDLASGCMCLMGMDSTLLWESIFLKKPCYLIESKYERPPSWQDLLDTGFVKVLKTNEFPEPFVLPSDARGEHFFKQVDRFKLQE